MIHFKIHVLVYWTNRKKLHGVILFPSPSSCYTSSSNVLPYILFHSFRHILHTSVGRGKYVITFTSDQRFGIVAIGWKGLEANTAWRKKGSVKSDIVPTFLHGLSVILLVYWRVVFWDIIPCSQLKINGGVVFQKIEFFMTTTMKVSYPTIFVFFCFEMLEKKDNILFNKFCFSW